MMALAKSRRSLRMVPVLLALALLGACQPGWVRLDGEPAGPSELQRARAVCEVDAKLARLEASRDDAAAEETDDANAARMLRIENDDLEKRRVYREIEDCMRRQGLQPGS